MYNVGIAYLLWLISGCGALGFHRFYLGKIPTGVLWMLTGGLGMVGSVYDFFTLPNQVREANYRQAIMGNNVTINIDSQPRGANYGETKMIREKDSIERVILRMAKENKGILTATDVALAANVSVDEAKRDLEAMVSKGFAELRVRQSGAIVYTIPDLMDQDDPLVI